MTKRTPKGSRVGRVRKNRRRKTCSACGASVVLEPVGMGYRCPICNSRQRARGTYPS